MKVSLLAFLLPLLLVLGCAGAQHHRTAVSTDDAEKISVGTVQREIRVGMSGAEVATVLGSPNVVTTDENRRETWIFDKISTERAYSSDKGGFASLILGGAGVGAGMIGGSGSGSYSSESGATSTSQKTLTIVIKFDDNRRVRDFAYHTSRF